MARRRRSPLLRFDISTELDGKRYEGTYAIESGVVRVSSPYGSDATQIGNSSPETIARILLAELVTKYLRKHRPR
jgi:hypothetical protein